MRLSLVEQLKPKALEFLKSSSIPVGIGDVAKYLNVSWSTGRQVLMELMLEDKVECQKTTKSRIFRLKELRKRNKEAAK